MQSIFHFSKFIFLNKNPKEWKIITEKYFICPIQKVFVQVNSNGFLSLFCVLLLSFWISVRHCWRGRGEIILPFVHIWLSSNSVTQHFSDIEAGLLFWNQSLLLPLTKNFCLKGAKTIMCPLIWLKYIFSLGPKKAVSLLCIQCNDSMKYGTLNAYIFQWNEILFLEIMF